MSSTTSKSEKKNEEIPSGNVPPSNGKSTETADGDSSSFTLFNEDTTERNLAGLLRLPDIDDTSMAHVFEYMEHYQEDLFWSFLSDSFFMVGGIVYVVLSIWDFLRWDDQTLSYKTCMVMGPLVYLVNSIIDIVWANRVSRREKVRRRMKRLWEEAAAMASATEMVDTTGKEVDDSTSSSNTNEEIGAETNVSTLGRWKAAVAERCAKIRRHAAHRRTVLAAITFGLAALAAFVAVIIDYSGDADESRMVDICNYISINTYVVSALISVTGKRTRPWLAHRTCLGNHETLEDLGDLFFLIGSLVDGVLCDFDLDDKALYLGVFSSLLWLLDACFYILSDIVMAEKLGRHYQPGSMGDENDENDFVGSPNVLI